ncbi:acyl-CoA dehydrogenase [Ideonella sp. DXS29W]|uniref:Acyl-coenzyme A dehydrogenase n=1 Tax=Ideonella lacteola TaxID=2984193 RepID=A0ABU9BXY8_9BURK
MAFDTLIGRVALGPFSRALPQMGDTERAALEAGSVGFEGDLFRGAPDWDALRQRGAMQLSETEQAFVDREVTELTSMLDDFAIDEARDLPPPVWQFLRERRFFGMIIPRDFGGLGFSHAAHATVVARIATVNVAAAVTVMVPNSLGPAELLLRYGTELQKRHWLPRLADGRELPCFGLTSPYAGSDAASIPDTGVLCERMLDGRMVRGFEVSFDKRYITLAPVATVVGLAFQAIDPDRPAGQQALGITCALIPVPSPGLSIGRRHRPMNSAFMNGPIHGERVFVPLDWVIGGEAQVGQGWRMLMECLAAGRSISLPALGSAMQQTALFVAYGYGRIREQFGLPIGKFHAVAGLVARMAIDLYATDAARRYTAAALDAGEQPSLAGAILKVQLTEAGRRAVTDAMDILGGKGIIQGPSNLLGIAYRHTPIAITVEGANVLTRALIIFGQGAVRCHPHVLNEMRAVAASDERGLGRALRGHVAHLCRNLWHSAIHAPLRGTPPRELRREAAAIAQLAAVYAWTADLAMGLLGGRLKRLELLSARLGDVLSNLYLASAVVWRFEMEGDGRLLPLARAAIQTQLAQAADTLDHLYANLPSRVVRGLAPLWWRRGRLHRPVADETLLSLATALQGDPTLIGRLCPDLAQPAGGGLRDLMDALALSREVGDSLPQLHEALRRGDPPERVAAGLPNPKASLAYLRAAERVIRVDDFAG